MMRLVYLPANQSWAFMFGDALCGMGRDNITLFPTRFDACDVARAQGLSVSRDGTVRVEFREHAAT